MRKRRTRRPDRAEPEPADAGPRCDDRGHVREQEHPSLPTLDPDAADPEAEIAAEAAARASAADRAAQRPEVADAGPAAADGRAAVPGAHVAGAQREERLSDPRLGWRVAAVAAVAAVLALIAALVLGSWWAALHAEQRAREEVAATANDFAVHLATFSGATIDDWVAETQAQATGAYAQQVDELFHAELRQTLAELEVVSSGEVLRLFVQALDGDTAEVFAVVQQRLSSTATAEPVDDELRLELELTLVDGRWLASDVVVLGPQAATVPDPTAGEERRAPTAPGEREGVEDAETPS